MRKLYLLFLALALVLLVVSCNQEIKCKLSTPGWVRGDWTASGEVTIVGEGSSPFTGSFKVTRDNITGSVTIGGTTGSFDWKADMEGKKEEIKDFSQNTTSNQYSFTVGYSNGGATVITFTKGESFVEYTEIVYVNGITMASTSGTLIAR